MKRQHIIFTASMLIMMTLSACNSSKTNSTKDPVLSSEIDSLNYSYGVALGNDIKINLLSSDSIDQKTKSFIKGLEEGSKTEADEKPGNSALAAYFADLIKQQESSGLFGDSTIRLNFKFIKQGLINGLNKSEIQMTPQQANEYINKVLNARQEVKMMSMFGENKEAGESFLAENGGKAGVVTTPSGLQYEVIEAGNGPKPTDSDVVKVHYTGTLLDGSEFDSSFKRNEPAEFSVNQVIPGWKEGLLLMPVGSKYRFYIPQQLAYGAKGARGVEPLSMLIYDVELLEIVKK